MVYFTVQPQIGRGFAIIPLVENVMRLFTRVVSFLPFAAFVLACVFGTSGRADDLSQCNGATAPPDARIAACTRVIASNKVRGRDLAIVYSSRSGAYEAKGDFDHQIADSDAAVQLDPKNSVLYYDRALAYRHKGDYDHAIADFSAAIQLDPKDSMSYNSRSVAYREKGDYDHAIADLNDALRIDPKNARAYHNRGLTYEAKGDLRAALADFRMAQTLDPRDPDGVENTSRVERKIAGTVDKLMSPQLAPVATPLPQPAPVVVAKTEQGPVGSTPPPPLVPAKEVRVALVIGNGNYLQAPQLVNPPNDAADIATALRRLGFDVVEGRDLDRHGLEDKIREFGRKLDGATMALFYYAGHGLQVAGRNYLVPTDAKLERPGDLSFETIDVGQVLAQMDTEKRVNLIILDACRDNPLARSLARSLGTRSIAVGQGLATVQSAVGTMIVYATQPDNVALDGQGRNSPFTGALLKHLATPGLEIRTMMTRVRADVVAATNERQVPWDSSSLIGEVVLVR
jgi:tetratricopeptide (TPR) repeat protein